MAMQNTIISKMSLNCQTVMGTKKKKRNRITSFLVIITFANLFIKDLKCKHVKINMNLTSASSMDFLKQKRILEKQRILFTFTPEFKWNVTEKQTIK